MKFAHDQFDINLFSSSHVEENKASGRVREKCGLHFIQYGEFQKLDGTCKMRSMEYEGNYIDSVIEEQELFIKLQDKE